MAVDEDGARLGALLLVRAGPYRNDALILLECLIRMAASDPRWAQAIRDYLEGVPGFAGADPDDEVECEQHSGDDCQRCDGVGSVPREPLQYHQPCRGLGCAGCDRGMVPPVTVQ